MKAAAAAAESQGRWLDALPEAPTYHPTREQWADPLAFVRGIQAEAARFGLAKVVPPLRPVAHAGAVRICVYFLSSW